MIQYYICFCNGGKRKILQKFKEGFRHCFVAIKFGAVFIVLEDSFDGFFFNTMFEDDFFRFTKFNKCSILILNSNEPAKKRFGIWYWAPTCVNYVKTVCNLRTMAQTPWQLYKYLLKKGATKWVDTSDKLQDSKPQRKQKQLQPSNKQSLKKKSKPQKKKRAV